MVDPRRLLTFREVAHRASFSRAAEALALTQPAVSQQVAALERAVGTPLLVRGPGGPTPTDAGALLLEHSDAIAERLALATTQLAEVAGDERRRLRLGAFPSALATLVPGTVAALRASTPALEADVSEATNEALVASVRAATSTPPSSSRTPHGRRATSGACAATTSSPSRSWPASPRRTEWPGAGASRWPTSRASRGRPPPARAWSRAPAGARGSSPTSPT